jgi:tRNA(adenine34) deaminase
VPVGAVLIDSGGEVLSSRHNQTIRYSDPTAHAEILAIRDAAEKMKNYRLVNTTLYVTIEPCLMCMGALIHSRVSRLVFGAFDSKWGAAGSLFDFSDNPRLNHRLETIPGICRDECKRLLQIFFQKKRNDQKNIDSKKP